MIHLKECPECYKCDIISIDLEKPDNIRCGNCEHDRTQFILDNINEIIKSCKHRLKVKTIKESNLINNYIILEEKVEDLDNSILSLRKDFADTVEELTKEHPQSTMQAVEERLRALEYEFKVLYPLTKVLIKTENK